MTEYYGCPVTKEAFQSIGTCEGMGLEDGCIHKATCKPYQREKELSA